ncbi:DUF4328 domain-containing protein [Streptomyces sp. NPDC001544]|uniref:DUF4328 domain-containing protein n=1 Tax=Streptomyces sp. NPDC001544 TaxID=3364584 RepID=UPI00368D9511
MPRVNDEHDAYRDGTERFAGPRPGRAVERCAVGGLLLAGAAWAARAVWHVRLFLAGEPASGPPDQGDGVHRTLTGLEDSYHVVNALGGGATLICVLAFLSWLWRVRDDARVLSAEPPRYSGIWVYLGWILPIMNLWVPRGIVVDVYEKSAPGRPLPRSLNVWWGLWLLGMLSGVGLLYEDSTDEIIERAYTEVWPLLAADAAVVGAAIAGAFVVRAVSAVQRERLAALTGGPGSAAAETVAVS